MKTQNVIFKKLKKQILLINNSIEGYFNKLKLFKSSLKKGELIKNNKVFFGSSAVVILTLGYFLLPTIYDKSKIQSEIKTQFNKKYNIEVKFNEKVRYGLIPNPHFTSRNLSILNNGKEIGIVKDFKIFIGIKNLFSINNLDLRDLVFKKADFDITKNDLNFFTDLLTIEPNENKILFKKNNIFFKNSEDELLFLDKITSGKFYYDSFNLENVLIAKSEIFNIPYKLTIKNDKFNKEILIKFDSKKIRLKIENLTSYDEKYGEGMMDIQFINKNISFNYQIKKNSLEIVSEDKKTFKGFVDFKPFYLKSDIRYDGISTKNLLKENSIIIDLIKSEIFNNDNLNVNLNFNIKDITNISELNNLNLNINLDQGNINLSDSKVNWKSDLVIKLIDSYLNYNSDGTFLTGKVIIDTKNIDNFYKSYQIKKIYRKQMKKIEFDYNYNFDLNSIKFDNIVIDEKSNSDLNEFINSYNSSEKIFLNKVMFKNFINDFFKSYSG